MLEVSLLKDMGSSGRVEGGHGQREMEPRGMEIHPVVFLLRVLFPIDQLCLLTSEDIPPPKSADAKTTEHPADANNTM